MSQLLNPMNHRSDQVFHRDARGQVSPRARQRRERSDQSCKRTPDLSSSISRIWVFARHTTHVCGLVLANLPVPEEQLTFLRLALQVLHAFERATPTITSH